MVHRRICVRLIFSTALVAALAASAVALAAAGDLDPSFSGDGKLTRNLGTTVHSGSDRSYAVAIQSDGKILTAGDTTFNGDSDFGLTRHNSDGSLDTSFGDGGFVTTDFGSEDYAKAVAIQADGKIVVAGRADEFGTNDWGVARYNPDGSLDPSFSGDGKLTTDFGGAESAYGIAIQVDGKIVVVGWADEFGANDWALARYNANGTLDSSFSGDGKQTTNFADDGSPFQHAAFRVVIQADGKLVVCGGARADGDLDFGIARYRANGALDGSFDGDGKAITDLGGDEEADDLALQPDGKIVVTGYATDRQSGATSFVFARYRPDGTLDSEFSGDGLQTAFEGNSSYFPAVAIAPDGKIVAAAGTGGIDTDFAVARLRPDGELDGSFSGDGLRTTSFGSDTEDFATGVAIQPDGKVVVTGQTDNATGGFFRQTDVALARFRVGGALDPGFDGDGLRVTDFAASVPSFDSGNAVAIQSDGKIIVGGGSDLNSPEGGSGFVLTRFNPSGMLDAGFGSAGLVVTRLGSNAGVEAVAIQPDHKIVAVGYQGDEWLENRLAVARYNPSGALDTSFSGDGEQSIEFDDLGQSSAADVAFQANGKIVVAVRGDPSGDFGVARFNPDGSLDTGFSGDGKTTTSFGKSWSLASGIALQADGKIVLVGYVTTSTGDNSETDFALARFNPDGSLDRSFSGNGRQKTDLRIFDDAADVAVQPNGKLVVAGQSSPAQYGDPPGDFAVARYGPSGDLDPSFSSDGMRTTSFGDVASGATSVELQADGRILVGGSTFSDGGGSSAFALARHRSDGALDTSFSGDGKTTTSFGGYGYGLDLALAPDGKAVMAGTDGDLALARYLTR